MNLVKNLYKYFMHRFSVQMNYSTIQVNETYSTDITGLIIGRGFMEVLSDVKLKGYDNRNQIK